MFSNTLPLIFVTASFQSGIKLAWPKAESRAIWAIYFMKGICIIYDLYRSTGWADY